MTDDLLLDQLQQTLAEPHCCKSWHDFYSSWDTFPDTNARQQIADFLARSHFEDPRAEVLRLTFLRDAFDDPTWGAKSVSSALAISPDNPDRLAAFAAFSWGHAVKTLASRQQLIESLQASQIPVLHNRLLALAQAQLPALLPARYADTANKIAIVTPYLGNRNHAPSVTVLNLCEVLAAEGKTVKVFSCQELQAPDMSRFFGTPNQVLLPPIDAAFLAQALPTGVSLTCSAPRRSLTARWSYMYNRVAEYDPDVVLACGLYSPFASALYHRRALVALNVHAFQPIGCADLWLSSTPHTVSQPDFPWSPQALPPQQYFHPYRVKRPTETAAISRAELGLGDQAVLWITIGGRLPAEIRAPWADQMVELMVKNPAITWLLVGGTGTVPTALSQLPLDRVKVLSTRSDIGALLRISDIYINPPRVGGGFSVAEAMSLGIPAISLADSDGGDKLGKHASATPEDYLTQVQTLSTNPALRKTLGAELQQRFAQHLDLARSGSGLIEAFAQAGALARKRLISPSTHAQ